MAGPLGAREGEEEHLLVGGNVASRVVRVGATVRRLAGPWSASVDALLLHLEKVGYPAAPRALGYDNEGRQVLSYVEGTVDADPGDLDLGDLARVGRLIRDLHRALASFTPAAGAVWNVAIPPEAATPPEATIPPDRREIVTHNDLAPWNLVRGDGRVWIDWDGAGPGTRLWDLAYAAHGFAPLSPATSFGPEAVAERLASLVEGYGLDTGERSSSLDLLARRIWSMHDLLADGYGTGREPWAKLWTQGHGEVWAADACWVESQRELLEAALLV